MFFKRISLFLSLIFFVMTSYQVDGQKLENYGADLNYDLIEAETQVTNAELVLNERDYYTFGSEASARGYVKLNEEDDYLSLTLSQPADSLILRYSVPDSQTGGGIDTTLTLTVAGVDRQIPLSSKLSWLYGKFPWSNDPKEGKGHNFYDEVTILFDKTLEAGTELVFKKTAANKAAYYVLDSFNLEVRPKAIKMPANAISIADFGADGLGMKDDSGAFEAGIEAALAKNKTLFIPAGIYSIANPILPKGLRLVEDGLKIQGAGMWHTELKVKDAAFYIRANEISLTDFKIVGQVDYRRDNEPPAIQVESNSGPTITNITIENLWIEHTKVGVWVDRGNQVTIKGNRIRNVIADGINLCKGTTNSLVYQNDIRNTGDDGIALWSQSVANRDNQIYENTVQTPWLANNIALYGGQDNQVYRNHLLDTVAFGAGINISTRFKPQPFAGTISIYDNLLERTGSFEHDIKQAYGGIWFNTEKNYPNQGEVVLRNNRIEDSTYQGVFIFNEGRLTNLSLLNNHIENSHGASLEIATEAQGELTLKDNQFTDQLEINNLSSQFKIINQTSLNNRGSILLGLFLSLIVVAGGIYFKQKRRGSTC